MSSSKFIITTTKDSLAKVADPSVVMNYWDKVGRCQWSCWPPALGLLAGRRLAARHLCQFTHWARSASPQPHSSCDPSLPHAAPNRHCR
jgi:hypothetical protein